MEKHCDRREEGDDKSTKMTDYQHFRGTGYDKIATG